MAGERGGWSDLLMALHRLAASWRLKSSQLIGRSTDSADFCVFQQTDRVRAATRPDRGPLSAR